MLTMRFVAVRDVLYPSRGLPEEEEENEGLGITTQGNNNPNAQWSIQVQHGGQRQRTRSIAIATKQKPGQEPSQKSGEEEATVSSIWDEEIEIEDVEREDTVEISLLCDLAKTRNQGRTKLRHSSTSLEMRTFRGLPDQRVSLWIPLRSTTQDVDQNYGELHLSLTYCTDDCIVEGYLFGLFCGLAPPSLTPTWLTEIPFMRYASDASKTRTPLRSSRSMPLEEREASSSSSSQEGLGFVARSLSFPAFGANRDGQLVNMRRKPGAARGTKPQGGIHVPLPMEEMGAL